MNESFTYTKTDRLFAGWRGDDALFPGLPNTCYVNQKWLTTSCCSGPSQCVTLCFIYFEFLAVEEQAII